MSCTTASTRSSGGPNTGVSEISTGNSVPSARSAIRPDRALIGRMAGAAAYPARARAWAGRSRPGTSASTGFPTRSADPAPKSASATALSATIRPLLSTISTASGDALSNARSSGVIGERSAGIAPNSTAVDGAIVKRT